MYTTITNSDFHQAFHDMGREDTFSYDGRNMLFNYLEQLEEDTGQPIELAVIALCCEYVEATYSEVIENYSLRYKKAIPYEKEKEYVLDYLNNNTCVIGYTGDRVVYQVF
jgi:hypothetical protein